MTPLQVSVGGLGSLSADQDGRVWPMSSARCRRRWPRRSRGSHPVPGYPAVMAAIGERARRCMTRRSVRRPGEAAGGKAAGLDLLVAGCAASLCAAGQSVSGTGWAGLAGQCAALRRAVLRSRGCRDGRCGIMRPTSCMRMTGRPALAPAYLHYRGGAAAGHGDDGSQSGLSGQVPAEPDRTVGLPPDAIARRGRISTAPSACSRPGFNSPTGSPPCRRPMQRNPHRRERDGVRRFVARARRRAVRHSERHRHRPGTPPPTTDRRRYDRKTSTSGPRNKAALQARMGLDRGPRCAAVRRGQPADLAKGHGPAARRAADLAGARWATRPAGRRRSRPSRRVSPPPPPTPARSAASSAMTRRWRSIQAGATRCWCRRASSPAA